MAEEGTVILFTRGREHFRNVAGHKLLIWNFRLQPAISLRLFYSLLRSIGNETEAAYFIYSVSEGNSSSRTGGGKKIGGFITVGGYRSRGMLTVIHFGTVGNGI